MMSTKCLSELFYLTHLSFIQEFISDWGWGVDRVSRRKRGLVGFLQSGGEGKHPPQA